MSVQISMNALSTELATTFVSTLLAVSSVFVVKATSCMAWHTVEVRLCVGVNLKSVVLCLCLTWFGQPQVLFWVKQEKWLTQNTAEGTAPYFSANFTYLGSKRTFKSQFGAYLGKGIIIWNLFGTKGKRKMKQM